MNKIHPRRQKRLIEAQLNKAINDFIWERFDITNKFVSVQGQAGIGLGTPMMMGSNSTGLGTFLTNDEVKVYKYKGSEEVLTQNDFNALKKKCREILSGDQEWALLLTDNSAVIRDFAAYVLQRI